MNKTIKVKNQYLYLIVVLVILVAVIAGYYAFSTTAAYIYNPPACPRWKCTDTQTYTCPSGTTSYICQNSAIQPLVCFHVNNYSVSLSAIAYQGTELAGIFTVNTAAFKGIPPPMSFNVTFQLRTGQKWTLPDGTIFGVTTLISNYTEFYLQSTIQVASSSLTAPFTASTLEYLLISQTNFNCPTGYTPSCSGGTLTCTGSTSYICSSDQPFSWCTISGGCRGACPV